MQINTNLNSITGIIELNKFHNLFKQLFISSKTLQLFDLRNLYLTQKKLFI